MSISVEIIDPPHLKKLKLVTKDISDTDAFIFLNGTECPPVGRVLSIQLSGAKWGGAQPTVPARIVRVTSEGIAVQFLDFEM